MRAVKNNLPTPSGEVGASEALVGRAQLGISQPTPKEAEEKSWVRFYFPSPPNQTKTNALIADHSRLHHPEAGGLCHLPPNRPIIRITESLNTHPHFVLDGSPGAHLNCALTGLLPLSSPMVSFTVTGFSVPVKSAPLPSTLNS